MAAMSFTSIAQVLPEHLVDHIARVSHKEDIVGVLHNIMNGAVGNLTSDFDRAMRSGAANIKDYIAERYGDKVKVVVDDYVDWYTIAFVFPHTSRFALYHHFAEWQTCNQYLIDGFFTHDTIHIERYLRVDRRGEHHTHCDHMRTNIPFKTFLPNVHKYKFDLSACGEKIWKQPVDIMLAFNKVEYGEEMEEDE